MSESATKREAKAPSPIWWMLAAVLAIMIGITVFSSVSWTEPEYKGKSVTLWLHDVPTNTAEAVEAFNALGTNAAPSLVRIIGYREPWIKRKLNEIATKRGWTALVTQPTVTWELRRIAAQRMKVLVPQAQETLPKLATAALSDDPGVAMAAVTVLEAFGSSATEAFVATFVKSKHSVVRMIVAQRLGDMKIPSEAAVEPLIAGLSDPDPGIRTCASLSLGQIAKKAEIVIPALQHSLQDKDARVRGNAIYSLSRFGPAAQVSIPMLRTLLRDSDTNVAISAKMALLKIDPEGSKDLESLCDICRSPADIHLNEGAFSTTAKSVCRDCFDGLLRAKQGVLGDSPAQ